MKGKLLVVVRLIMVVRNRETNTIVTYFYKKLNHLKFFL